MEKKVFAFDLDGTLTQHRTWITNENLAMLDELKSNGVRILILGAGQARRIFTQLREYPADILGNYGLQYAVYREELGDIAFLRDVSLPCDRESVLERIRTLREKTHYTDFRGETAKFYSTGSVILPLLGTKASVTDKLVFDPDREKRRAIYPLIAETFPEYSVFLGGLSSIDLVPKPYDKYYALSRFCEEEGFDKSEAVYFGDDYGLGGNDECIYHSDIDFVGVDDYRKLPELVKGQLSER